MKDLKNLKLSDTSKKILCGLGILILIIGLAYFYMPTKKGINEPFNTQQIMSMQEGLNDSTPTKLTTKIAKAGSGITSGLNDEMASAVAIPNGLVNEREKINNDLKGFIVPRDYIIVKNVDISHRNIHCGKSNSYEHLKKACNNNNDCIAFTIYDGNPHCLKSFNNVKQESVQDVFKGAGSHILYLKIDKLNEYLKSINMTLENFLTDINKINKSVIYQPMKFYCSKEELFPHPIYENFKYLETLQPQVNDIERRLGIFQSALPVILNIIEGFTKEYKKSRLIKPSTLEVQSQWGDEFKYGGGIESNNGDVACKFPFKYKEKEYTDCTDIDSNALWCSSISDFDGEWWKPNPDTEEGVWGYCKGKSEEQQKTADTIISEANELISEINNSNSGKPIIEMARGMKGIEALNNEIEEKSNFNEVNKKLLSDEGKLTALDNLFKYSMLYPTRQEEDEDLLLESYLPRFFNILGVPNSDNNIIKKNNDTKAIQFKETRVIQWQKKEVINTLNIFVGTIKKFIKYGLSLIHI